MDLLELEKENFDSSTLPSSEDANALLREDDPLLSDAKADAGDPVEMDESATPEAPDSSPTAAVRSAIEAQINEGMSLEILQFDATLNTNKTNAIADSATIPLLKSPLTKAER